MNQFGMGLVLDFTDNASQGMMQAANVLQQLEASADKVSNSLMGMYAASQSMYQIGSLFENQGKSIISTLFKVEKTVFDTGQEFFRYGVQLKALYGEDEYQAQLERMTDYAKKSVFTLRDLMGTVTRFKAVGIEAFDAIASKSGKTTENLMDAAADLAAMIPNIRTAGGTGVQGAAYAIQQYISEGQAISLKRGLSLDIKSQLGEGVGATEAERTRQIIDLVEKLGIAGYQESVFKSSPTMQLSNLQDAWDVFLRDISDAGVFSAVVTVVGKVVDLVEKFTSNEERMAKVTHVLGTALSTLITPFEKVVDFVGEHLDQILDWITYNEEAVIWITKFAAGIGIATLSLGKFLKMSSGVLAFIASMLAMNKFGFFDRKKVNLFRVTMNVAKKGFKRLLGWQDKAVDAFEKFEFFISSVLGKQLPAHVTKLELLGAQLFSIFSNKALLLFNLITLGILAIKNNVGGLRDRILKEVKFLTNVFAILFDAWDNQMSLEHYDLMQQMGIEPFINGMLRLRDDVRAFFSGFDEGASHALESIMGLFNIDLSGDETFIEKFVTALTKLLELITGSDANSIKTAEDRFRAFGKVIGNIVIPVIAAVTAISLLTRLIGNLVVAIKVGMSIFNAFSSAMMFFTSPIGVVILLVAALALLIITHWKEIKETLEAGAKWFSEHIVEPLKKFFDTIGEKLNLVGERLSRIFGRNYNTTYSINEKRGESNTTLTSRGSRSVVTTEVDADRNANGTNNFRGGFSYVNEEGGELVQLPTGTMIMPHDASIEEAMRRGISIGAQQAANSLSKSTAESTKQGDSYSISFAANSIVVKCDSTSTRDLETIADRIYRIIKRRIELEKMAKRNAGVYATV